MNNQIVKNNNYEILANNLIQLVLDTESKIKELKQIQDEYKKSILEVMQDKNIIKLVDDISGLSITLVEAKNNLEKFNQAKFKEENPDMYDEYVEFNGKKNAYLIIKNQ